MAKEKTTQNGHVEKDYGYRPDQRGYRPSHAPVAAKPPKGGSGLSQTPQSSSNDKKNDK